MFAASCVLNPINSHSSIVWVVSCFWALRAAFMCSWLALVLDLSSKFRNTNSVKDIDYYIVIIASIASRICIIIDLNSVREIALQLATRLTRRLVRRIWSVWLNIIVISCWFNISWW